jgi:uncharacterized protein
MKVFLTGGTGFIGRHLCEVLTAAGHEVTVLTRSRPKPESPSGVCFVTGDPTRPGSWQDEVPRHQAVINLAGSSIAGRWKTRTKERILDSRLLTTHNLVTALKGNPSGGIRLLSASAVGYYGLEGKGDPDESSPSGPDFLALVCDQWESRAMEAERFGARVAICRFGIVLGRKGGALKRLMPIFRRGLGARLGKGNQGFSWIHIADLAGGLMFLLERPEITGPVNCTAPNPVSNREMTETLNRALGKRGFPVAVPGFLLRLLLGESAETLLGGRMVRPGRLQEAGFAFRFSGLDEALTDILGSRPVG